jgi:hypothetical protein
MQIAPVGTSSGHACARGAFSGGRRDVLTQAVKIKQARLVANNRLFVLN